LGKQQVCFQVLQATCNKTFRKCAVVDASEVAFAGLSKSDKSPMQLTDNRDSHFFAQVVMEASDAVTETTTLVLQEAGSLAANQALAGPNQEDDELYISRRIGNRRGRIAGRKTIGHSCVEVLLASSR
jgi:hypothetical protein